MLSKITTKLSQLKRDVQLAGVARGDLLYRGASKWQNLAAGAAGLPLRSGGPGADPSYGAISTAALPTGGTWTLASTLRIDGSRVGLGDTPDAPLSIAAVNNATGHLRFQHPSANHDAGISVWGNANTLSMIAGVNQYYNAAGNLSTFDNTQTGAFFAFASNSLTGNFGTFFGSIPSAGATATYFGLLGQTNTGRFIGVYGGTNLTNMGSWTGSIMQIRGAGQALLSVYDTTNSKGHDLASVNGSFHLYEQGGNAYRLTVDDQGRASFGTTTSGFLARLTARTSTAGMVGLIASAIGSTVNDMTQDALRIIPTGTLSTWYRALGIYAASSDTAPSFYVERDGKHQWGAGGAAAADVNLYRAGADLLKTDDKLIATAGLGVGNSAAATTLGAVTRRMEVFDANGASLGFVPIYASIT